MEQHEDPVVVVSIADAEHYRWGKRNGAESDGWFLLRAANMHIIEERMPPGAREALHVHGHARQFFYVLEGELIMKVEETICTVRTGQGVEVCSGRRHQVANQSAEDVRILVISQPPSHGDRIDCV